MRISDLVRPSWCPIGAACLLTACSLSYDPGEQCSVDSDCVRLARSVAALKGTYCKQHVCVHPQLPSGACETNAQCIEQNRGAPAICRDYACMALQAGDCALTIDPRRILKQSEDVVVLGALSALGVANAFDHPGVESMALAANLMQERVGGAVGFPDPAERRPFVFVVCDTSTPSHLDASIDHLTRTLKVPVVVSTVQPSALRNQWSRLQGDPEVDTLFINALATDSSLGQLDTQSHIWSLLGDPLAELAPAYLALTERQLRKIPLSPVHLLIVVNDVQAMRDISDYLVANLLLNGQSLVAAPRNVFQIVPVGSNLIDDTADTSSVTQALEEVDPDVVVALGGSEIVQSVILANETRPPTERSLVSGAARYYVLSHHLYNLPELTWNLPDATGSDRIENRMLGINFAGATDDTLYNQYLANLTLQATLDEVPTAAQGGYENFYDAAQYAMLSVVGAATQRATTSLNGSRANEGFARITDMTASGPQPGLSPDQLASIAATLERRTTNTLAVTGTMGPPDFDHTTFSRRTGASIWCLRRSTQSLDGWQWVADYARFNPNLNDFDRDPDPCAISVSP